MKHLTSQELRDRTKKIAEAERRITVSLIEHLEEIRARRLYLEWKFDSLWEYATQELGLSEGAAQRRISAMRLIQDAPEAKDALQSGTLTLSNAAKLESFRRREKKNGRSHNAQKLVEQVQNMSQKDCDLKLFEISPQALPHDTEKLVSAQAQRELKFVVSAELYEKIQRLKALLAHARPEASYAELLEYLIDPALEKIEKKKGIIPSTQAMPVPSTAAAEVTATPETGAPPVIPPLPAGRRVYLPVAITRPIWARSGGRCEMLRHGRRCRSRYRLEIDHIIALALGGSNHPSNLRVLCRSCNQARAIRRLPHPNASHASIASARPYAPAPGQPNSRPHEPVLSTQKPVINHPQHDRKKSAF